MRVTLFTAWLVAVGIPLAAISGCSPSSGRLETALPERIDYRCANQRLLQIKRLPQQRAVLVQLAPQQQVTLPQNTSAAQEKYSDGRYTLYLQGERAMLEDNGQVLFGPCQAGPLPKRVTDGFDPD